MVGQLCLRLEGHICRVIVKPIPDTYPYRQRVLASHLAPRSRVGRVCVQFVERKERVRERESSAADVFDKGRGER